MAYDLGVRQELNNRGISNDRIGYDANSKTVLVDNQPFMKPERAYNGSTFTSADNFNNAYNKYMSSLYPTPSAAREQNTQPQPTTVQQPQTTQGYSYSNPYDSQTDELIRQLLQQAQNPTPIDRNAAYSSPQYAAYQAQANRAAQQGVRAAQEAMGSAGFGRSTALGERAQNIQNQANEYLELQAIPQIISQMEAQRQQELQNQYSVLDALMNQQGVHDTRYQNDRSNAIQLGQLTGNYLSPELENLYNQVLEQKQAYANATTDEERQLANQTANQLREQILRLGGRPDLVGADVTLDQAAGNRSQFGIPTMDRVRFEADMQNLQEEKAYRAQRDSEEDRRWWADYERAGEQFAQQMGYNWAQLNQRQKEFLADEAHRSRQYSLDRERLDLQRQQTEQAKATNLDAEKRGLVAAIRNGEISPTQALVQIEEDTKIGFYTPQEAAELKKVLSTLTPNMPDPVPSNDNERKYLEDYMANLPSDKELDRQARERGYPIFDYRNYMKDIRGAVTGISFDQWKQLYGPTLK